MKKMTERQEGRLCNLLLSANTLLDKLESASDDGEICACGDAMEILDNLVDALRRKLDNVHWAG